MKIPIEYQQLIKTTAEIALATSVNDIPNVRIINIVSDSEHPEILYFSSDRRNPKVKEFASNANVAFTTIPTGNIAHIRSSDATVQKSTKSIDDIKDLFIAKIPDFGETIEAIGETLDIFEIHVKKAVLITGFDSKTEIEF